jgi:hypothetical protein
MNASKYNKHGLPSNAAVLEALDAAITCVEKKGDRKQCKDELHRFAKAFYDHDQELKQQENNPIKEKLLSLWKTLSEKL